jgi:uncharacterized protein DUF2652
MKSHTDSGVLLLADISGFTAFVSATALEHGPAIIAELLEAVMGRLSPPLDIQEVEGDAVFAVGSDRAVVPPRQLLDVVDDAFAAFKGRQRAMLADESCSCDACSNVAKLDLKIVVHHGRFLRQLVGGRGQLAGVDVILAHQLLKNRVGKRTYVLLTEAALRWIGIDGPRAGLASHVERYEHLGDVRCFVKDVEEPAAVLTAPVAA